MFCSTLRWAYPCCVWIDLSRGASRSILQDISAEEEKALQEAEESDREADALREFSKAQAEQEGEKKRQIDAASERALELVEEYWKLSESKTL